MKKLLLLVLIIVAFAGIKEVWDEGKTLSSDSFSASGERADSGTDNRPYTCPQCGGEGLCQACDGIGTYFSRIAGRERACAVCRNDPGICQTCDGYGTVTTSNYQRIGTLDRNRRSDKASCSACGGSGYGTSSCSLCNGTGINSSYELTKGSAIHAFANKECSKCSGSGREKCTSCWGTGTN